MRIRLSSLLGLLVAVAALFLAASVFAADKPAKKGSVQGRVHMLDKDSFTVEVKGGARRKVVYDSSTKFMYGHSKDNKPGSADQIKENYYLSCTGTYADEMDLKASTCVYREQR